MQYATEIDEVVANRYGNRYLVDEVPSKHLPDVGMPLARDIALACQTLDHKGGIHESERTRVKTATGY